MLKLFRLITSILLIGIIFFRIPREDIGLSRSFGSAENFLNILTAIGILIYFGISFQLNLETT